MKTGPIELQEIVEALSRLGGQARAIEIKNKVTEIRGGIPSQYQDLETYHQTIQAMIQVYCPQSENWRSSSSDVFTRVDRGLYKLTKPTDTARLSSLEGQVIMDLASISQENSAIEGGKKERLSAYFERNPKLRAKAILLHGTSCKTCGFNFEEKYGEHGKDYIEVHHLVPISTLSDPKNISPKDDLTVLCSNCHRMIHRKMNKPMSINDLSELISKNTQVKR